MSAILSFLGALPDLLAMIKSVAAWVNHVSGNDPQGFAKQVGIAFDQLAAAQTQEDRQNAAKSIAGVISGL